ncbi:hypothetical protein J5N97_023279 [Dioscorea zingiberensis]|uniref:Uncharacterized protein n=1 Tax=Dioscorea zingiberensis TaxID=325984 RepID=A0A9D5CBZ6_9LILI|nr:hypothetical protein J5N97_023279 [Dioscorea zingiberensis]
MARTVGKNMVAPLLFLNLVMYIIVLGFASWCLNHFINGQSHYPGVAGNGATFYFLVFATLAGVVGVASKLASVSHVRVWRNDSLAAASSSSLIAWAITALAFGLACKEIHVGGYRGWRLRVLEAFIIILAFTQFIYVVLLHAGMISGKYGPAYSDPDYGHGAHEVPTPKSTSGVATRVV